MHRSERWPQRMFLVKPLLRDGFALKATLNPLANLAIPTGLLRMLQSDFMAHLARKGVLRDPLPLTAA